MKKNVMMRIASILVVAVLLTTCVISGTFAKYVITTDGEDSARVAKFGVQLSIDGDSLFENEYEKDDDDYTKGDVTVKAINTDLVVAPGTKSEDGVVFKISGKPEVATKIDIEMTVNKEVFLAKGNGYKDFTVAPFENTFDLSEDYYPIVFTLTQGSNTLATGKLDDIKTFVEAWSETAYYEPNTKLDAEFTLNWEWDFEGNDKADTLLGDLATGSTYFSDGIDADSYSTEIDYELTITVTQVD